MLKEDVIKGRTVNKKDLYNLHINGDLVEELKSLGFQTHRLSLESLKAEKKDTSKYLIIVNIQELSEEKEVYYLIPQYQMQYESFKSNRISIDYNRIIVANGIYVKI